MNDKSKLQVNMISSANDAPPPPPPGGMSTNKPAAGSVQPIKSPSIMPLASVAKPQTPLSVTQNLPESTFAVQSKGPDIAEISKTDNDQKPNIPFPTSTSETPGITPNIQPSPSSVSLSSLSQNPTSEAKAESSVQVNSESNASPVPVPAVQVSPTPPTSSVPLPSVTTIPSETPTPEPAESPSSNITVTTPAPSKKSKFGLFIGILIFIVILVFGGVGYLFLQNTKLESGLPKDTMSVSEPTAIPTQSPPIEANLPKQIVIENGSVVSKGSTGDTTIIINKTDYPDSGIIGFTKVIESPDGSSLCVETWPPAPTPAIYIADIDGGNVRKITESRRNCNWSQDSKKIVYLNYTSDTAGVDIFMYDTVSSIETNLTSSTVSTGFRYYSVKDVTNDKILCSYTQSSILGGEQTPASSCEIDMTSGEFFEVEG